MGILCAYLARMYPSFLRTPLFFCGIGWREDDAVLCFLGKDSDACMDSPSVQHERRKS